jgi:Kdo2-lipid IVA lauroyltransferase/acyltransferase
MNAPNKRSHYRNWPFISYLILRLTYLVSLLPLRILYFISSGLSFLLHKVFRYRLHIVRDNLKKAFPEKTFEERVIIERGFYDHFSDVLLEVIKLKTMSFDQIKKRCIYSPESLKLMKDYFDRNQSIIIVMAHQGNWEMIGTSFPLYHPFQVITAYRPLRDKVIDADTLKVRQRTGNILSPMKSLPREMLKLRKKVTATALISDQTPSANNAFWANFLNQETPFFKGAEILSQKFNYPVFWGSVRKPGRGKYFIELKLITDNPAEFKQEGELTALHAKFLEFDIREQPEIWLWTHRRWKHKRPENIKLVE